MGISFFSPWEEDCCRWVCAIKVKTNGKVDQLKARLVAKDYTQIYGLDYNDTFSLVTKFTTIQLFLTMVAIRHWPLYGHKKCLSSF